MQAIGENCGRIFFITAIPPVELCFIVYYASFLTNLYRTRQYNLYTYTKGCECLGGGWQMVWLTQEPESKGQQNEYFK